MLTEKDYCDYETSRELKELGFVAGLGEDDCGHCLYDDAWHDQVDRPLLYEAQKWLREEKDIHIEIDRIGCPTGYGWQVSIIEMEYNLCKSVINNNKSYEDALSEGIKEAVKILKEKLNEET